MNTPDHPNIVVAIVGEEYRLAASPPSPAELAGMRILVPTDAVNALTLLVPESSWDQLVASGRIAVQRRHPKRRSTIKSQARDRSEQSRVRRAIVCQLIRSAVDVPIGDKSIAQFMHANWTPELERRWGPADPPGSIRRWISGRVSPSAIGRPGGKTPRIK